MPAEDGNGYAFTLLDERYLEGLDTRCIVQYQDDKFVVAVWGESDIYVIDRDKPDGAVGFSCGYNPCKQNLSIVLLPYFHIDTFPFAFVLS